jgi:hypothetical protein
MIHFRRISFVVLVAGAIAGWHSTVWAQNPGGRSDGAQPAAGAGAAQPGAAQPSGPDLNDSAANPTPPLPPPSPRSGRFDRVKTSQRQVMAGSPKAGAARSGAARMGAAEMTPNGSLGPYSAQAVQMGRRQMDPRVPQGSSWQDSRRTGPPPPVSMRSTTHNYYPGLRPGRGPNASAGTTQARRGGSGLVGGTMGGGMLGGSAGRVGRNGAAASAGRGPAPGRR